MSYPQPLQKQPVVTYEQYGQQQQQYAPQQQQQYAQQPQYAPPQQLQPKPNQQPLSGGVGHPSAAGSDTSQYGPFAGGNFSITHRDTNAVLTLELQQPGVSIKARPGAMIHMSSTIELKGNIKFSFKKLLTGGQMAESLYTGVGRIALAPTLFGDIITLPLGGNDSWLIGKDAFLACTSEIVKKTESQGVSKAFFSGEDLFVYRLSGQGHVWLTSFGAVDRIDLPRGQTHIVDNGHLVAWNCGYNIEKAGGSTGDSLKSGEGLVCRFTGPGSIYVQTRNEDEFKNFIRMTAGAR